MFSREDYYNYLSRIKGKMDLFCNNNSILLIHPIDVALSQCFFDMLLLSSLNIDDCCNAVLKMVENIYLDNKDYFDDKNKNLNPENKINGVTLSFDKNIKYETEEDIKKELQDILEKNSDEIIITPTSTKIH
jgi:hypothetical protein